MSAGGFESLVADMRLGQSLRLTNPRAAQQLEAGGGGSSAQDQSQPVAPTAAPRMATRQEMARAAAVSAAKLEAGVTELNKAMAAIQPPPPTLQERVDQAREVTTSVMAKAMAAFERGEITGHQVRLIETRANQIIEGLVS